MTKKGTRLIEDGLPVQFIYDLGLYLQTCAHIELNVCGLIIAIEDQLGAHPVKTKRLHELRKRSMSDLISDLKKFSEVFVGDAQADFVNLVDWIDQYKLNRHIAAHGAFSRPDEAGNLRVLYTHVKKDHGKKVYYPDETVVSQELVNELINDADRVLRIVTSMAKSIEGGEICIVAK